MVERRGVAEEDGAHNAHKDRRSRGPVQNVGGHHAPQQDHQRNVETSLEANHRVRPQVVKIDLLS